MFGFFLYYYRNSNHIYCNKCEYKELTFRSNFEKEVVSEIGNLIKETKYSVITNKHIYNGKEHFEVDILIPELNLAIDCNGLYWHSELQKEDNFYHYKKKEFIENCGYSLIYIWEDDWNDIYKKDIILSRLSSKLKLNKHIYARKCLIKLHKNNKRPLKLMCTKACWLLVQWFYGLLTVKICAILNC